MGGREQRTLWRFRVVAGLLLLTALAFHQAPGQVVPDTKLDLTAAPGAFLGRALHMWDPQGAFGQLQNQAYGYLFPVGPFHWALDLVGVPEWVVQRLWWSLILGVAFLGYWKLAGALRLGEPWTRYLGAFLYALTPRLLGEVAITSVEVWPVAMAPWVLLPLVVPEPRSWAWRISRSALAFLCVGGVNAVASGATLVLPTLWFATRARLRESATAFAAWLGAVVAVSLWWLVPLVLLGRYSPPFLDWIENAAVTTAFGSPFHALTGTTAWLAFLSGASGPSWPAGWQFVTSAVFILLATCVAALSLAGLGSSRLREGTFLRLSVLVGLALLTLGSTRAGSSPFGAPVQDLLDGALAPLRNTHKFELVLRLPLLLAASHAISILAVRLRRTGLAPWVGPVMVTSLVAAMAAPGIAGSMPRPEGYRAIPAYWHETAQWLDAQQGPGTVLVAPAASFADFSWGSTKDEPLQALMKRPFAVRDAVPLGSAGATRMLDGIQQRLASGRGGPDLRQALLSSGVRYVVLRNDLRFDAVQNIGLEVHEALAESGMTAPVRSFGPRVVNNIDSVERTLDSRTHLPYPKVEVFDVGQVGAASLVPAGGVVSALAGAEDVPRILTEVPGADAVLAGEDATSAGAALGSHATVLTDGNVRREVFFGRSTDNRSDPLSAHDPGRTGRKVIDFVADAKAAQTTRIWEGGLLDVTASSSAADANATLRLGSAHGPAAAVDGRPETAWVSGRFGQARGEWLQLRFTRPTDVEGTTVRLPLRSPAQGVPAELLVQTDAGEAVTVLSPGATVVRLQVPDGPTRRLRIVVRSLTGAPDSTGVSIAEVAVPGLALGSRLLMPGPGGAVPGAILMGQSSETTRECAHVGERPLCARSLSVEGEEEAGFRRELTMPAPADYAMSGTVVARNGAAAERLVAGLTAVTATASSRQVDAPEGRPASAFDDDLGTGWVAGDDDPQPILRVRLPSRVETSSLQFQVDQYLAASRASEVELTFDDTAPITSQVDDAGFVRWSPRSFQSLSIRFLEWTTVKSVDGATGLPSDLPVGVSEVRLSGVSLPERSGVGAATTGVPCGFGPDLVVAGRRIPTAVSGTVDDVLRGNPMRWYSCGSDDVVSLPAGAVAVDALASGEFAPLSLALVQGAGRSDSAATAVTVTRHGPAELTATLPTESSVASLLVLPQNYSTGWTATTKNGTTLEPLRVNGWQQGWVVPPGTSGQLTLRFGPDTGYRLALLIGGLVVLACCGLTVATRLRRRPEGRSALTQARYPAWARAALVVGSVLLISGATGVVSAVLAVLVLALVSRRNAAGPALAGLAMAVAGVLVAVDHWPTGRAGAESGLVQAFVLVGVVMACGAGSVGAAGSVRALPGLGALRHPRRPHRTNGRSSR